MKRRVSGVTLIEIMVAMVVLAVGLYMIYNIFPMAFASSYRSKNRLIASQLAQQKLELVIQNREPAKCFHETGNTCRVRPIENDYTVGSADYDDNFDCRYYYGGSLVDGKVSNGCRCRFHSGDRDVANSWKRCSEDPADSGHDFWYHIDITPVTDACKKYRSLGDLVQATVRVRGPIDSADIATETNWQSRPRGMRMAVEAVLTTMIANDIMGNTVIDQGYNTGNYNNGILNDTTDDYHGRKIRVKDIRNFTMFMDRGLSSQELEDRPRVSYFEKRSFFDSTLPYIINMVEMGGNYYKLDNIAITRHLYMKRIGSFPTGISSRDIFVTMTNKIMKIEADTVAVDTDHVGETEDIPGFLCLAWPLYADSNYYPQYVGTTQGFDEGFTEYVKNHAVYSSGATQPQKETISYENRWLNRNARTARNWADSEAGDVVYTIDSSMVDRYEKDKNTQYSLFYTHYAGGDVPYKPYSVTSYTPYYSVPSTEYYSGNLSYLPYNDGGYEYFFTYYVNQLIDKIVYTDYVQ